MDNTLLSGKLPEKPGLLSTHNILVGNKVV
jgi:hypothetical protein